MWKLWYLIILVLLLPLVQCRPTRTIRKRPNLPKKDEDSQPDQRFDRALHRLNSYQHSRAGRRRLVDHLNDDDGPLLPSTRSWTIECVTPALFQCPACRDDLRQEQDNVLVQLRERYPFMRELARTHKILNAIYVELPFDAEPIPTTISGIRRIAPQQRYTIDISSSTDEDTVEAIGANVAHTHCLTGKNITVGVLDTGIDYTHDVFGGNGTLQSYRNAYGDSAAGTSGANSNRDGYFPTSNVIEGKDFLGEHLTDFVGDDDPIDGMGHGTAVASAIVTVAPDVQLIAVKSCVTSSAAECPDFALILGIEYLLDPNEDGNTDDKVDIINLSLGAAFSSAYHDFVAVSLEHAHSLGVVCVTSFGNDGNLPYVAGAIGTTPNVIAVGAVNHPTLDGPLHMKDYSARGPGEGNLLKPDISAPSNSLMALMGTGWRLRRIQGTSFCAPLVAGAAALLLQRCPECTPLAIKSLLMNTADRQVHYSEQKDNDDDQDKDRLAPVTRMGSGSLRIDQALTASFWAYSLQDVQPSLSLGLVDAAQDMVLTRSIVVFSLDSSTNDSPTQTVQIASEFRDLAKQDSGAVTISFDQTEAQFSADCGDPIVFTVSFHITAALAPPNTMTTSGRQGSDPEALDRHEWDGHIVISSKDDNGKEIVLPFHMLLRQAAAPKLAPGTVLPLVYGSLDQKMTIINEGAGVAQIDAFDLIYSSADDPEAAYGFEEVGADIRTIGYRTVPVNDPGCDYMVEFSWQTWERTRHVGAHTLRADLYPSTDADPLTLWIPTFPFLSQSYILDQNGTHHCTGLPSDHSSNTANTIMRACSNDLLLDGQESFRVRFRAYAFPTQISTNWKSELVALPFPTPLLHAPSYDIQPGETLTDFHVTGTINRFSHGLQLVTNSFRDWDRTGAATFETETLMVVKQGIVLESELTPDIYVWPTSANRTGPVCGWKLPSADTCTAAMDNTTTSLTRSATIDELRQQNEDDTTTASPECAPVEVPRVSVPTHAPSMVPSSSPTAPTAAPSEAPTILPRPTPTLSMPAPQQPLSKDTTPAPEGLPPTASSATRCLFGVLTTVLVLVGPVFYLLN
jgi:hypothetical protein